MESRQADMLGDLQQFADSAQDKQHSQQGSPSFPHQLQFSRHIPLCWNNQTFLCNDFIEMIGVQLHRVSVRKYLLKAVA